jgi:hypothetical protein
MEETRPTELFIDLFYVGIIAINAQNVARNPTGFQLHVFALTFTVYTTHLTLTVVHHGGYGPISATWYQPSIRTMSCSEWEFCSP